MVDGNHAVRSAIHPAGARSPAARSHQGHRVLPATGTDPTEGHSSTYDLV